MKTIQFILLSAIASFFFGGCSTNLELDNPRELEVIFLVDGNSTSVPAGGLVHTNIEPGQHKVQVKSADGEVLADTTFEVKEGGVLHSAGEQYVVWRQLYGLQDNRKELLNENWVKLDSVKVHGDLRVYPPHAVYIEKTWDKGLADDLPKESTLYITSDFVIKSKIFRVPDFIDTYRSLAQPGE